MEKLLLITPPFVQVNCPYPATAYLKGYLTRHGHQVEQYDLSIELINRLFSRELLQQIFDHCTSDAINGNPNLERIYALRETLSEYDRYGHGVSAQGRQHIGHVDLQR